MQTITDLKALQNLCLAKRHQGKSIGFVPTMGALHEGHLSLIRKAAQENDFVVVSIFVNPIQFGPNEDLETYPRSQEKDIELAASAGATIVFLPQADTMYQNQSTFVHNDSLSQHLCGLSRPGHFRGVLTVVLKFFHIVQPTRAYFGEKDAQQLILLQKMVDDLNVPVSIIPCPIVRAADGLALSSRNKYLSETERKAALCLSQAVELGKSQVTKGCSVESILIPMRQLIEKEPLAKIDYLSVVSLASLEPVSIIQEPVLVAMAVWFGKTRLLDNFFVKEII